MQHSYSQHYNLTQQREGVKNLFGMTLTLVLLLAMLTAIYGAIYSAEKLTRPVQDLIAGTRAVGKGDFGTRLPLPSRDEMGFLVHSFNDMTKRLRRAREETTRSQHGGGARARTPVDHPGAPVDRRHRHRPRPGAAQRQPGGQQHPRRESRAGRRASRWRRSPATIRATRASSAKSPCGSRAAKKNGASRWISSPKPPARACWCAPARRCPATNTPRTSLRRQGGYVIVFDDISALLQAQRDAAWGEVARRLAHEIKNPLTPIQLSAERMRRRYLAPDDGRGRADPRSRHVHHRAAGRGHEGDGERVQRIRARAGHEGHAFPLNALVTEVADLHRVQESGVKIDVELDPRIENVEADRGRVRQILNNLIVNGAEAVENAPDGHVVAVHAARNRRARPNTPPSP